MIIYYRITATFFKYMFKFNSIFLIRFKNIYLCKYHVRNVQTVSKLILIDVITKIVLETILATVKTNDRIYMLH